MTLVKQKAMRTKEDIAAYAAIHIDPFRDQITSLEHNCLRLCMCVFLEQPIHFLPAPDDDDTNVILYWETWRGYFESRGYSLFLSDAAYTEVPKGLSIAVIDSPYTEDSEHAVITFNGVIIYDPAEGRRRIKQSEGITYWVIIHPLDVGRFKCLNQQNVIKTTHI